jgi:cob(I)alamin adenosyltransferase
MILKPLYLNEQSARLLFAALQEYQAATHHMLNAWTIGPEKEVDIDPLATTVCRWAEVETLQMDITELFPMNNPH